MERCPICNVAGGGFELRRVNSALIAAYGADPSKADARAPKIEDVIRRYGWTADDVQRHVSAHLRP